jgi:hypothetical protein
VTKYCGDANVRAFLCLDQFLCMSFAQLTYRESLRDIEACLGAQPSKLYTWAFEATSRAATWPTPTNRGTGASTRTLRSRVKSLETSHAAYANP